MKLVRRAGTGRKTRGETLAVTVVTDAEYDGRGPNLRDAGVELLGRVDAELVAAWPIRTVVGHAKRSADVAAGLLELELERGDAARPTLVKRLERLAAGDDS